MASNELLIRFPRPLELFRRTLELFRGSLFRLKFGVALESNCNAGLVDCNELSMVECAREFRLRWSVSSSIARTSCSTSESSIAAIGREFEPRLGNKICGRKEDTFGLRSISRARTRIF